MIDRCKFKNMANAYDMVLTSEMLIKFDIYAKQLVEYNQKVNLTAIVEPEQICIKHFLDSLLLLCAVPIQRFAKVLDVGAGAGFPSIPCHIVREDWALTLIDSLKKRVNFLDYLSKQLNQQNHCIHGRAEEIGRLSAYREQYDLVTARAVTNLRDLAEYCLPFVKKEGVFVALKGQDVSIELEQAMGSIQTMGGELVKIYPQTLPDQSTRQLVVIKKHRNTSSEYPRCRAKMNKTPLHSYEMKK